MTVALERGKNRWDYIKSTVTIPSADILNVISKMLTDHPSPTGLWLGPQFFVVLDHPVDIETVLTSPHCMDKADIYQMVRQVLETDGLVSNHGIQFRLRGYIVYHTDFKYIYII